MKNCVLRGLDATSISKFTSIHFHLKLANTCLQSIDTIGNKASSALEMSALDGDKLNTMSGIQQNTSEEYKVPVAEKDGVQAQDESTFLLEVAKSSVTLEDNNASRQDAAASNSSFEGDPAPSLDTNRPIVANDGVIIDGNDDSTKSGENQAKQSNASTPDFSTATTAFTACAEDEARSTQQQNGTQLSDADEMDEPPVKRLKTDDASETPHPNDELDPPSSDGRGEQDEISVNAMEVDKADAKQLQTTTNVDQGKSKTQIEDQVGPSLTDKAESRDVPSMSVRHSLEGKTSQSYAASDILKQPQIHVDAPSESDEKLDVEESKNSCDAPTASYDEGATEESNSALFSPDVAAATQAMEDAIKKTNTDNKALSSKKKGSKHTRTKHLEPKVLEIRRRIQVGCRDNDLGTAMTAYKEAIRNNVLIEAQSFYNLLNLCDGLERAVHVGTPKGPGPEVSSITPTSVATIDNKTRQEYAFQLKDHMARLDIPLNEAAYTAIVKVLVRNKEYEMAETVLQESGSIQQCKPKLRLYTPLLLAYCEERDMINALKSWLRITTNRLELTEREFLALMKCAIVTGDVHVFGCVLREIADTVAVPSKETAGAILEWFESPHAIYHSEAIRVPNHADGIEVKALLDEIFKDEVEKPPSMDPVQTLTGWDKSSSVQIDTKTGVLKDGCLQGCVLKPVPLSQRSWDEMMTMNEKIVLEGQLDEHKSQFQGGRKGKIRNDFDPQERREKWKRFTSFLDSIGPIDVVIDSANVGYFKQNFSNAPQHVDYDQIDWVARHFLAMGKKVLLILHNRHFHPRLMPGKYRPLQEEWERMRILYKTPGGMNDDWFWLHAALKYRALVLTNDEMRDHHFQMLAPRTFLRWKERHQVHFNFGDWGPTTQDDGRNKLRRGRIVELEFPAVYSRRVQRVDNGLVVPLIKRGDENRFLDGAHVASDDEPIEETYLCIRAMK